MASTSCWDTAKFDKLSTFQGSRSRKSELKRPPAHNLAAENCVLRFESLLQRSLDYASAPHFPTTNTRSRQE